MAEHHDITRSQHGAIGCGKCSPQHRRLVQYVEVVAGGELTHELLRPVASERYRKERVIGKQSGKHVIIVAIGLVFLPREVILALVNMAALQSTVELEDADYFGGSRNGKRPQRNTVQHAEDSRIEADAECDGEHRDSGEGRILAQRARGIAKIVPKGSEVYAVLPLCVDDM